jgi:hypothetical protein
MRKDKPPAPKPEEKATRGETDVKEDVEQISTGQMFSIFGCEAGFVTPADSTLSAYILDDGKRQVATTGVFTTLNNKWLRRSIPNAEVTDSTT